MPPDQQRVCDAWHQAAQELGFQFTPSFPITLDGHSYTFLGLVHGFGGPNGALLALYEPGHSLSEFPQPDRYHVSLLSASSYDHYERQHFIDTLDDLQWFGPDRSDRHDIPESHGHREPTSNHAMERTADRCAPRFLT